MLAAARASRRKRVVRRLPATVVRFHRLLRAELFFTALSGLDRFRPGLGQV
jgi:hypothetical protein